LFFKGFKNASGTSSGEAVEKNKDSHRKNGIFAIKINKLTTGGSREKYKL